MLNLVSVESGHIEAMGWEDDTMIVRFKTGAEYMYNNVSFDTYESIKEAPSVGSALARCGIKGNKC